MWAGTPAGGRHRASGWDCCGRRERIAGRQRPLRRLLARFGQLHGPSALFAGIDLEEAGAVKTARQTIGDAANGELLVAGAHEGLPHPLPAVVVIDSVNIIISCDEIALEDGFAGARGQIPPALRGPAVGVLVTDRDADAASGIVAEAEIGGRRLDPSEQHEYPKTNALIPLVPA